MNDLTPTPTVSIPTTGPNSPVFLRALSAALSGLSAHSCRVYSRYLSAYLSSGLLLNRECVVAFLDQYKSKHSSYNQALSAIKRLSAESAENGWLDWPTARAIDGIKSKRSLGSRAGNWLTKTDATALLALPNRTTLSGKRDAAVLALLLGCGLRRSEITSLALSQYALRNGTPHLVDIVGKGGRVRTVAVPSYCTAILTTWITSAQLQDATDSALPLIRSFLPDGTISQRPLCVSSIRSIVMAYAAQNGLPSIRPHDLRRTFAKLARKSGCPLDVIQRTLGHASVQTTEIYTNAGEEANAGDWFSL
jgi:integrase